MARKSSRTTRFHAYLPERTMYILNRLADERQSAKTEIIRAALDHYVDHLVDTGQIDREILA